MAIRGQQVLRKTWIPESRMMILKRIYLALMGLLLLGYPYMMITYTHFTAYVVPVGIWVLRLCSAGLAIYLGKLWRDKGFLILCAYLLLIFLRVAIPNSAALFTGRFSESILSGVWVFSACYGLARILSPKEGKCFLRTCAAIWMIIMATSSCVGIVAAWQHHRIYTWDDAAFWGLYPIRLMMPYLPTMSGSLVGFSILIALCVIACEKNKAIRILSFIIVLPMMLALSLTDSRTSFISTAFGVAVLCFLCMIYRNRELMAEKTANERPNVKKIIMSIAVSLVAMAGTVLVLMYLERGFHSLKLRGGLLISNALAEAAEESPVGRGFSGGSEALTGRYEFWIGIFRYLKQNPLTLLIGEGKADPISGISRMLNSSMAHAHNMPLMILVESGIPGLAIIASFIVVSFKRIRKALYDSHSLYPAVLLAIVFAIVVGDLAECFAWMASSYSPLLPFLLMAIGVLQVKQA